MSSSFTTLLGATLEALLEIWECLEQLHTVSTEYTVLRENGLPIGLEIHIRCLLAEQKETSVVRIPPKDLKKTAETLKKIL